MPSLSVTMKLILGAVAAAAVVFAGILGNESVKEHSLCFHKVRVETDGASQS